MKGETKETKAAKTLLLEPLSERLHSAGFEFKNASAALRLEVEEWQKANPFSLPITYGAKREELLRLEAVESAALTDWCKAADDLDAMHKKILKKAKKK
jgi:hypothetical protein